MFTNIFFNQMFDYIESYNWFWYITIRYDEWYTNLFLKSEMSKWTATTTTISILELLAVRKVKFGLFPYKLFHRLNFHMTKFGFCKVWIYQADPMRKKCPYSYLFWSAFSRIRI